MSHITHIIPMHEPETNLTLTNCVYLSLSPCNIQKTVPAFVNTKSSKSFLKERIFPRSGSVFQPSYFWRLCKTWKNSTLRLLSFRQSSIMRTSLLTSSFPSNIHATSVMFHVSTAAIRGLSELTRQKDHTKFPPHQQSSANKDQ